NPLEREPRQSGLRVHEQGMLVELEYLIESRGRDRHARTAIAIAARRSAAGTDGIDRCAEATRAADHFGDLGGRAGNAAQAPVVEQLDVLRADGGFELGTQRHLDRSPIFPGLNTCSGSSAVFAASKIAIASRCSPAMNGALSNPTPW